MIAGGILEETIEEEIKKLKKQFGGEWSIQIDLNNFYFYVVDAAIAFEESGGGFDHLDEPYLEFEDNPLKKGKTTREFYQEVLDIISHSRLDKKKYTELCRKHYTLSEKLCSSFNEGKYYPGFLSKEIDENLKKMREAALPIYVKLRKRGYRYHELIA